MSLYQSGRPTMPGTDKLNQKAPARVLERDQIPNLDLAPLFQDDDDAKSLLIEHIRAACLGTGFFYVHNSCVPDQVIQSTLEVTARFFKLPDDSPVKQCVHNENAGGMKGWGPIFGEPAYQKDTVAHVECFDLGQQLSAERYGELGIRPNLWPDIPGFRDAVLNYYEAVTRLGRALSEVFSEILGKDSDFINRHSGEKSPRTMRLLHYPENDAPADHRNVGISAHTDFEFFTIMNQTAAGLELTTVEGSWCEAPSDIGTFTVILGDILERLSNNYLKATGHRVVNTPWTRYSMILFFAIDGDYTVSPLPHFIGPGRPAAYPPITQDEHIEQELERAIANSKQE
jgi:isopenicillin N synthase-like dioxygenase